MSVIACRRLLERWTTAAAVLFLSGVLSPAQAANYFVGADAQCGYTTIQAAVTAALATGGSRPQIYVASNQSYANQAISISPGTQSHIGLNGGVTHCGTTTVSGTTTINGGAGTGTGVITIRGAMSVGISHLTITGGHHNGDGGGIDYSGTGMLTLDTSTISDNAANYGAGINMKGAGGAAVLQIGHDTLIIGNTASTSGGGIRLEGTTTMTMNAPSTWVALNEATSGYGGGIEVLNGATANIGSPGYGNAAVIYENSATYGGGIAVTADAYLNLYTTDPLHPIGIDNNTAFNSGGGIHISADNPSGSDLCAANFRITNNIAQEGTGLYADVDSNGDGTQIFLNSNIFGCADRLVALGGVACDASQPCNIIHSNIAMAVHNLNTPTAGAAMLLQSGTFLTATKLDFRDNHGGYALRELGNTIEPTFYTDVAITNCVFADNVVSHELINVSDGVAHLNLYNCTMANDAIGGAHVIAANDVLALNDSIIDEGSIPALAFSGSEANLANQYTIAGNTTGLGPGPTNIHARPTYVDGPNGDYRLFYGIRDGVLVSSAGLDYAPPQGGVDIRDGARDQAISATPLFGTRDIGAYEMQGVGDRIFIDSFGDPLLLVH